MLFDKIILGVPLQDWLTAALIFVFSFGFLKISTHFITKKLGKIAPKTENKVDDTFYVVFKSTGTLFLFLTSLYLAALFLEPAGKTARILDVGFILVLLVQIAWWGNSIITFFTNEYKSQKIDTDGSSVTTYSAIAFTVKLLLFSAIFLLALDNLGFNVTTLIAGLGVGGIAIALAVQNILGDLFASLSIVLDKPFVLGDFIIVDNFLGVVEKIGLKTTRIRSLSGEQLIFSNNDLLSSRIRNFKRMDERRVAFSIGVTYQTTSEQLEKIPVIIKEIIENSERTRFDRSHFKEYGAFSLNFESVYYIDTPDFNIYMDIQQKINMEIFRTFEKEKIDFAYPTQTLFINKDEE
ncbi:MAG: hypothetical protein SCALA702_03480 [Melioribacteraceae bacterium]|nr:MAG: hypothetical protein SCALA702_03480 [Melioribacteraceae bacterium]